MNLMINEGESSTPLIIQQDLLELIDFPDEGMYSQVLLRTGHCTYSLIGIARGNRIDFHNSSENVSIQVLCGSGVLDLVGSQTDIAEGTFLFIPPHVTKAVFAIEDLALLNCVIHERI